MDNSRRAGVLLHPTALPGGVLDDTALWFMRWMCAAGLSVWQMLPLGPPHADLSPYQSCATLALNPALLPPDAGAATVDSAAVCAFATSAAHWLDDYALFTVLRRRFDGRPWFEWPPPLRCRYPAALEQVCREEAKAIAAVKLEQYLLQRCWDAVRAAARDLGITLFGDLPISVAHDSADVWAAQQLFRLDEHGMPLVVGGVPPDYFNPDGQRWGNPLYDWDAMRGDNFHWWRSRVAGLLRNFDLVRIDHFRGLQAMWEIPAAAAATAGRWVETPGRELLQALREDFPALPLVAEDLGEITPAVVALRQEFDLPGMAVLQFGFDGNPANPHLSANIAENCVAYTGTHDNDTTVGWFTSLDEKVQRQVMSQLGSSEPMPWPLIDATLHSAARLAVIPMQDWLALDGSHRFNVPGTVTGNWRWRFAREQADDALAQQIRLRLRRADRAVCGG